MRLRGVLLDALLLAGLVTVGVAYGWWIWTGALAAVLVGLNGWSLVRHRRRRWALVEAPQNVRVVYPDGSVVPVELVHRGRVDGVEQWDAVCPVRSAPGMRVLADMIPGETAINLYARED